MRFNWHWDARRRPDGYDQQPQGLNHRLHFPLKMLHFSQCKWTWEQQNRIRYTTDLQSVRSRPDKHASLRAIVLTISKFRSEPFDSDIRCSFEISLFKQWQRSQIFRWFPETFYWKHNRWFVSVPHRRHPSVRSTVRSAGRQKKTMIIT